MMREGQMLIAVSVGLAFCLAAHAISPDANSTPYQEIVDRNVFGLKPPPRPPEPEVTKPPPPKIFLTGILSGSVFGGKRALMKTPPPQAKPGEHPKGEQSYILAIGQREGDIEVLDIDEKAGSVKVNNSGSIVTLTFDKDGVKLPATPAPAPSFPSPTGVLPALMAPGARTLPGPESGGAGFSLPTRMIRSASTGIPGGNPMGVSMAGGIGVNGVSLPAFGAAQPNLSGQPPQSGLSAEEQQIAIEVQREQAKMKNDPLAALLPPTALNPTVNVAPPGPPTQPGQTPDPRQFPGAPSPFRMPLPPPPGTR